MWAVKAEWSEHQTATIGAIATTTAYNEGDLWFQDAFAYVRQWCEERSCGHRR